MKRFLKIAIISLFEAILIFIIGDIVLYHFLHIPFLLGLILMVIIGFIVGAVK